MCSSSHPQSNTSISFFFPYFSFSCRHNFSELMLFLLLLVCPSSLSKLCHTVTVLHIKCEHFLKIFPQPLSLLFSFLACAVLYHRPTLTLWLRMKGLLFAIPDIQSAHLILLRQTPETRFIID